MKKIIILLIIFLVSSFLFLAWNETQQQSPTSQNWWVAYFSNPKDESLNFVIENNSDGTGFHYEISDGENGLEEVDVEIAKGAKKEIFLNENIVSEKIIIRVSAGNEKRELYKNFDK
jgi:hypothetical protein